MYPELFCRMKTIFSILTISILIFGCSDTDKVDAAIEKIEVDLEVARFDREFAEAEPLDIPILKKAYPYLFPARYTDSVWVAKLQDTVQLELLGEVGNKFSWIFQGKRKTLNSFLSILNIIFQITGCRKSLRLPPMSITTIVSF